MNFTIIIPTRNRKGLLKQLLASIDKSAFGGKLDVIVINNNSQDETGRLLKEFRFTHPSCTLRVFSENRIGPSFCRNAGIQRAKWPHVIFVDDDCTVPLDYFEQYNKLWKAHPNVRVIGGRVVPVKKGGGQFTPKEQKHMNEYYGAFAITTLGNGGRPLRLGELLYTANMSIRLPKTQHNFCFDERLGKEIAPRTVVFAEDYELCSRLILLGERVYYSPDVVAYNAIESHRFSNIYLAKRQALSGLEQVLMEKILEEKFGKAYAKATWGYIYMTAIKECFRGQNICWAVSLFNSKLKLRAIASYIICKYFIFR